MGAPIAGLAAPAAWQRGEVLPKAMAELVGLSVGGQNFALAGLDDIEHVPYGAALRFDGAAGQWTRLRQMPGTTARKRVSGRPSPPCRSRGAGQSVSAVGRTFVIGGVSSNVIGESFQSDGMPGIDTPTASHEVLDVAGLG